MLPPNKTIAPRSVARPKLAPLPLLPVFFNVQDTAVLVAGNSEDIACKTELLLAAGAQVRLVVENPSEGLQEIIDNKGYNLIHFQRSWTEEDFTDVRLALGELDTPLQAKQFSSFAREHGIPVNVNDRPEFCDFQFGSIVNTAALPPKLTSKIGKVTLVGAGPGDAQLLTLKAVKAMQSADVILFDRLVSDEVLDLARRETRRMLVGKRGGQASCRQDDINALMVKLAKQGKNVVRLKSGDPMIFGRAGEEIAILEGEGIETEIVPGITAAMAAASHLGVSLTHRDCAQSVKFMTAHSRHGALPNIDWKSCVDTQTTLMVYMGAKTAPKLAEALIGQGANPATPVMIAKGISRPEEEVTYHRLDDFLTMDINRKLPVLIGIGEVFAAKLTAFENYKFQNTSLEEARILTA